MSWVSAVEGCPLSNGIATPGHTRACTHVKFAGAWGVKVMWKAKVKDHVVASAIASFMWT